MFETLELWFVPFPHSNPFKASAVKDQDSFVQPNPAWHFVRKKDRSVGPVERPQGYPNATLTLKLDVLLAPKVDLFNFTS